MVCDVTKGLVCEVTCAMVCEMTILKGVNNEFTLEH
jgi:hypothetical protein